ncbi:odorant receptor 67d-like [Musca vetustissima]|uniref:odorant receptor 67d-like n=1 Tax=Musca vetustissima TaxID=27455 RepID=UPI002AB6B843|nr:odorant receptor 67d-like [Musca vetustissima]
MNLEDARNTNKLYRPSERLRRIVRITRICGDICGADVLDPNYRVNIRTYLVFLVINFSIIFFGYTIYKGWTDGDDDWKIILQVLTVGGGTLAQGYCKLVNSIGQQSNFRYLLDEIYSVFEEYELKSPNYRVFLNQGCQLLTYFMKLCAIVNIAMICGLILVAIAISVVFNKHQLIVYGNVIGADPTTPNGFIVTMIVQSGFLMVGGFGLYAGDMAFFTPISQVATMKGVLRCKFEDINAAVVGENRSHHSQISHLLSDTYYWVILVQICTYSIGIVCSLFCILLGTWPGGYIYMIYCLVMMFVYCGIGTMVVVTNDGFIKFCYNDILWYRLSASDRKSIIYMLMVCQNTGGLTIGSVLPLSMNTGLKVTKTIYSIAMMLLNIVE